MRRFLIVLTLLFTPMTGWSETTPTSAGPIEISKVIDGLREPWGLAFLPDGGFLITERGGKMIHVSANGIRQQVSGVPRVYAKGQGGLLDVMVPSDFGKTRRVFFSYAKRLSRGAGTALAVGKLSSDGGRLSQVSDIFVMQTQSTGGRHFGSRIVEAGDGTIFLTLGERADRDAAQDLSRHNGSIIRINKNGSIPGDNPMHGRAGALSEIWSFGHRNPQGAALDSQGRLWVSEHGAKGGDEINLIEQGANYGWPVIAYGSHYTGGKIGEGRFKDGMEQPKFYWDPSIAPSGLMIYSGKLWPEWRGHFFVGSLKFDYLSRLDPANGWQEERIKSPLTTRVRDVREAPDGSIWILSVGEGAVFRLSPQ